MPRQTRRTYLRIPDGPIRITAGKNEQVSKLPKRLRLLHAKIAQAGAQGLIIRPNPKTRWELRGLIKSGAASFVQENAAAPTAKSKDATLELTLPTADVARTVVASTGRYAYIPLMPRAELFGKIAKVVGDAQAKKVFAAIAPLEVTQPTSAADLLGRVDRGIRNGIAKLHIA